jgi:glycosyltransferase involved in cell wall biosynthesis
VRWKRVRWRPADLVVSELGSGVLENYPIAFRHRSRFAVLGHGFAAVTVPNRVDAALEGWQIRRARHLFAYTDTGRDEMIRAGAEPGRITVVRNTIDTASLESCMDQLDESVRASSLERFGLDDSQPVAVSIGGLDSSKRLGMLVDIAERVALRLPGFVLVVAGEGVERPFVERLAGEVSWLRYAGRVDEAGKAALASVASLMLNPGRVGLVAIDSFVLGLPIVTTDWPYHAPEIGYLEHGRTAVIAPDDADAASSAVVELLTDRERLARLASACRSERSKYRLDDMVERFCIGIVTALTDSPDDRP